MLRHAKSDWRQPELDDFDRPLNKRGKKAIVLMARWLCEQKLRPDWVICSPSKRTRQTFEGLQNFIRVPTASINLNPELYLADLTDLVGLLSDVPKAKNHVLLIGHNPGLEELLNYLCGKNLPIGENEKCMPTAGCASILLPDNWSRLGPGSGRLEYISRPRDIVHSKSQGEER